MYFDDDGFYMNPFLAADKSYTWETAAYAALSDLQGSVIPRYYVSYSVDIPSEPGPTKDKRSVRLILIELISGCSVERINLASAQLSKEACQNIMKSIIEFDTLAYSRNILLRDLFPRNIILTDRGAVFIDFEDADIGMGAQGAQALFNSFEFRSTPYVSPLLRWHKIRGYHSDFGDWANWDWQPWLQAEFAHTADSITPGMLEFYMNQYFLEEMGDNEEKGFRMVVGY